MCIECGCEALGSSTGVVPVTIEDVSTQGNAGLNQYGSAGSLPITGENESNNLIVNM